ncbi:hypothetical protein [Luteimonas terricola]|uniref:Outer membrane beta-barrel protein n=1 Tax=Luteimonas terricola TaxID=645597 RepID=A0ABQ2EIT6_9GAMM|nr:hypothetical protein [Luteimonas terricola]GGK08924.1 hypothetical protein GCM10011394_17990 [Luteimonas terricola]
MRTRGIHPSALCAALLAAAPFHADAFRIDYVVDLGIEHDDNVLMSAIDPADSNALRAGFGFVVSEETSTVQANFGGRFEYWNYVDGPQSNAFDTSLAGRLNWFFIPEKLSFTIEDSLEMRPIDRFAPDTVDNRQRVNVLALGPNVQFNWSRSVDGRFELRWIDSRAEEADDLESQRLSAALHAIRILDSTSSLSLSLRGQDVDYKHDLTARDHRRYDGYLSYDRQLARLGFGLVAGYTWADYADGSSISHPLIRARAEWAVSARNSLSLGVAHQLTDSSDSAIAGITAATSVPDRLSTASVSLNSSIYEEDRIELNWTYLHDRLGFTFGPYYERIDFLDATAFDETRRGVLMQLSYRLAPTWDLRTYADVARSDFRDLDLRTEDTRFGFGLHKTWSRHWSSALDYAHYRREANGPFGDSRQNIWYLSVTYRNR